MTEINTANDHFVGVQGGRIIMLVPPVAPMEVDEALRLAAWIVALVEVYDPAAEGRFAEVLEAVQNT